jgi:type I restriction enzyme S subunit
MENWTTYTIGEIGRVVTGKTPSSTTPLHFGDAMPFVTPTDFKNYVKSISTADRSISQTGISANRTRIIPEDSVLVTCIGSDMGKVAVNKIPCLTNQQINSIILDKTIADKDFVYYALTSKYELLRSLARGGSTMPIINKTQFERIEVSLPPIEEQKAIAKILSSLDDKIELNRRMNATLEAMARALFRAWFVDFEPVHANKENRSSTSAAREITKLFPSEFENDIPKGWCYKPLGEIAEVNWGDTSVTKQSYVPEGFAAYSASGNDGFLPYFDFDRTGVVVSAIGANSGLTWLARGRWSAIKNTITIFASDASISTEYLYLATEGRENWTLRGSAQPFLSQADTRAKRVLYPANNLAAKFGSLVEKFYGLIEVRQLENASLAMVRDSLLPRLISGKIKLNIGSEEIE